MALFLSTRLARLQVTTRLSTRLLATQAPPPPPAAGSSTARPVPPASPNPEPTTPAEETIPLNRALLPSLDFDGSQAPFPGGRTGAKSAANSPSTLERRRKLLSRTMMGLVAAGLIGGWLYMGREWEAGEEGLKKDAELAGMGPGRVGRANARVANTLDYFNKPLSSEILPKPALKPYTLVLSLDDLLITSTWDRQNGWRTAKRPGVDYFIAYLSQFFEIVIFTSQYHYTAIPITEQLDPLQQFIPFRLFREYTRSIGGKIVKDLSYLNRDLSKVILIDTHPEHASAQPENAIILPKWDGSPRDTGLVGLIPFLESIGIIQPQDIRSVLKAYEGKEIASTFAQLEAEQKRRYLEQWEKKRGGKPAPSTSVGRWTAGSLFGGSSAAPPATDPSGPPLTYLELKRKEAQDFYRKEQQWLKENETQLKKWIDDENKKQMGEMGGSLLGFFTGANFKPPEGGSELSSPPPEVTPPPVK